MSSSISPISHFGCVNRIRAVESGFKFLRKNGQRIPMLLMSPRPRALFFLPGRFLFLALGLMPRLQPLLDHLRDLPGLMLADGADDGFVVA